MRKLFSIIVIISLFVACLQPISANENTENTEIYTIYENIFDNGPDSAAATQNEFMDFGGISGSGLASAVIDGNTGMRKQSQMWMGDQTFLFDLTKGGTKEGISSGMVSLSFDFSMDGTSAADNVIVGVNMTNAYTGERMVYFHTGGKLEALEKRGAWGNSSADNQNLINLDCDKVYNLRTVINWYDGSAQYFLDGELIRTQADWQAVEIENISIAMSGIMDYFDNLKITYQTDCTIYENTFDNGPDSAAATQNEFMDFGGISGSGLASAVIDGNTGMRKQSQMWMGDQTFLFDLTKDGTKEGISSGIISVNFDFSMDETSPADYVIIGVNMTNAYTGERMVYFHRGGKFEVLERKGAWGNAALDNPNLRNLDCDKVYNLRTVINLDDGRADYFLDGKLIRTQTNWNATEIENISIAMSGIMDYFDNLKITCQKSFKISTTPTYTVYENTFDNGPASAAKIQNEFMDFGGVVGSGLASAVIDGNTGMRKTSIMWMGDRTFLFDFTKGGTKEGVYSGKWTVSFDFSMDGESTADGVIIGMNMSNHYSGKRMLYFYNNQTVGATPSFGGWGDSSSTSNTALDSAKVYNLKTVIDFDNETAEYYLNDSMIGSHIGLTGITMNNFSIAMSGIMDYFDNLKITAEYTNVAENIVTSGSIGNIFYENEPVELMLRTINRYKKPLDEYVSIDITDGSGNTVWSTIQYVHLLGQSENEIRLCPELPMFGTYKLTANSTNSRTFTTKLSRSVRADELNSRLGVCGHFDGRHSMDTSGMMKIISEAGLGSLRSGGLWIGANEEYFETALADAEKRGIEIMTVFDVGVSGFLEDGSFNTTAEALEEYREYCRTVVEKMKGRVERFELGNEDNYRRRRARQSDIGNRLIILSDGHILIDDTYVYKYTGDYNAPEKIERISDLYDLNYVIEEKEDSSGNTYSALTITKIYKDSGNTETVLSDVHAFAYAGGDEYYKILKAGYDGIKAGNPNALVSTSGCQVVYVDPDWTTTRNHREFAKGILGAARDNDYYCFDAYAVHPYHMAKAPEVTDYWINNTKWHEQGTILDNLFSEYSVPQEKEKWATEFGYSASDADYANAEKKTAWIVRTILANEIYDCYDKMYLYDIMNDGNDEENSEHNFGTICYCKDKTWYDRTAYAAKPQYLAVAQYNKMLANAEFEGCTVESDAVYTAKFNKENSSIFAVWDVSDSNSEVTLTENGRIITIYDMYGNIVKTAEASESITVTAGEFPIYVEFANPKTEIKLLSNNTARVTVVNDTEKAVSPVVITAAYDEDGILCKMQITDKYISQSVETEQITPGGVGTAVVSTDFEEGDVRIMLWDSLNAMKPLSALVSKKRSE